MANTSIPNPEMVDDENPEWTDEMFVQAKSASEFPELQGLLKANRGRPKSDSPKISATLRYDSNILEYFKATGKGWQTRMNDVLAKYVASH